MQTCAEGSFDQKAIKIFVTMVLFALWTGVVLFGVGVGMRLAWRFEPALPIYQAWQYVGQGLLPALALLLVFALIEWWAYQRWPLSLLMGLGVVVCVVLTDCGLRLDISGDAGNDVSTWLANNKGGGALGSLGDAFANLKL